MSMKCTNIVILMLLTTACATKHDIQVDSLALRQNKGAKLYVEDRSNASEIEKRYFTTYVESALKLTGYQVVKKPSEADYFLYFNHATITDEKTGTKGVYQWMAPKGYNYNSTTYGQSGSYNTYGSIQETGSGHLQQVGTRSFSYTMRTNGLVLNCYDKKEIIDNRISGKKITEVWSTRAITAGEADDDDPREMRQVFPILLSAGMEHFGTDTRGLVKKSLRRPDEKLMELYDKSVADESVRTPAQD